MGPAVSAGGATSHTLHAVPLQPVGGEFLAYESPWDLGDDVAPEGAVDYPRCFRVSVELHALGGQRRGWEDHYRQDPLKTFENPQPPKNTEPAPSQT